MKNIPHIFAQFFDLLFPQHCIHCHAAGTILCSECQALVQRIIPPVCRRCGLPLSSPSPLHCMQCSDHRLPLHGIRATGLYQEPLRTYIHTFKYRGQPRLAAPLGLLLAYTYQLHRLNVDLITSVPLYAERQGARGYNQAHLLAQECGRRLNIPVNNRLLTRRYDTVTQTHLTLEKRYQNVAHAFYCAKAYTTGALVGHNILIIDDVCTTGSTLSACASALFAAGAQEVWGLVLARPDETKYKSIRLK